MTIDQNAVWTGQNITRKTIIIQLRNHEFKLTECVNLFIQVGVNRVKFYVNHQMWTTKMTVSITFNPVTIIIVMLDQLICDELDLVSIGKWLLTPLFGLLTFAVFFYTFSPWHECKQLWLKIIHFEDVQFTGWKVKHKIFISVQLVI